MVRLLVLVAFSLLARGEGVAVEGKTECVVGELLTVAPQVVAFPVAGAERNFAMDSTVRFGEVVRQFVGVQKKGGV